MCACNKIFGGVFTRKVLAGMEPNLRYNYAYGE